MHNQASARKRITNYELCILFFFNYFNYFNYFNHLICAP